MTDPTPKNAPDKLKNELVLGGYGIDLLLSEINVSLFLDLIDGTRDYDSYMSLADDLDWCYSNSNPVLGDCELTFTAGDETDKVILIHNDNTRIETSKRIITEPGKLYLLTTCNSKESRWHWIEGVVGFDKSKLIVDVEEVYLGNSDTEPWLFVESVLYGDLRSESIDASESMNYSFDLIGDNGLLYSLDEYDNSNVAVFATENLTRLIEASSTSANTELTQGALFRRGQIFLSMNEWEKAILDFEEVNFESSDFNRSRLLLARALISAEEGAKALPILTGLIDGLSPEVTDIGFIGKVYQERALANQNLRKNGDAISDYKKAIRSFEALDNHDIDLANCRFSLALLTERFTDKTATELFCKSISKVPIRIKELEPFRIKRLLLSGKISYSALVAIAGDILINERLEYFDENDVNQKSTIEASPQQWSVDNLRSIYLNADYEVTEGSELGFSIIRDGCRFAVRLLPYGDVIFSILWGCSTELSHDQLVEHAQQINRKTPYIRASVVESGIYIDYYFAAQPTFSAEALLSATEIFLVAAMKAPIP